MGEMENAVPQTKIAGGVQPLPPPRRGSGWIALWRRRGNHRGRAAVFGSYLWIERRPAFDCRRRRAPRQCDLDLFAGALADWIGRKPLMALSGVLFVCSTPRYCALTRL